VNIVHKVVIYMANKLPPREEYPSPSIIDLADAIEAAYNGDDWAHYVCGRYTAHQTHTQHNPKSQPGPFHITIRVEECERDVIMNIPREYAQQVISLFRSADSE
jgi:hypothetical protein